MSKRFAAALLGMALALAAVDARAELHETAGSVFGGNVDISDRGALSVGLGWPGLDVRYDFHMSGRFGLGIRGEFNYGFPVGGINFGIGTGFYVPMRINVYDEGDWAVAIMLDPGVYFGFDDHWSAFQHYNDDVVIFGPLFEFGVIASVEATRGVNVFFGLRLGIDFLIAAWEDHANTWDVWIPVLPFGGVEIQVADSVALFIAMHVGPAVGSSQHCAHWDDRTESCNDWDRDLHAIFAGRFKFGAIFYF